MPLSDVFSVTAGIIVLTVNLYLTYLILSPECHFTSIFITGQAIVGVLFFVYAAMIVAESGGELGIGYLVYHILLMTLTSFNLYLVMTRKCPLTPWRQNFRNGLESAGWFLWPVRKFMDDLLPQCKPCNVA